MQKNAVLITGGTDRLGLAMAQSCLEMGYPVILHFRSSADPARKLLSRSKYKDHVHFIHWDLSPETTDGLIAAARSWHPLCGLVNNASIFTSGSLETTVHFNETIATNTMVPLALARTFAQNKSARWIINITDAHIDTILPRYQNYRLSKLWLEQLTSQMAVLWAPRIRVNALAPGAILAAKGTTKESFRKLAQSIPLKRTGTVGDIRKAFEFLVEHQHITGQNLHVDGGWHLKP